jgi:hypothetical protein
MRGLWLGLFVGMGCRNAQESVPFEDCQPYPLECATCDFSDDLDGVIDRVYRCETDDGEQLDAVQRPGIDQPTTDTHFYEVGGGFRVAASRRYNKIIDVCGKDRDVEWYGEILEDCVPICELDASLPEADEALPSCD